MNVKQLEIEAFLLCDICTTVPNILSHLRAAHSRGVGELVIPAEHVDAIVTTLQRIEGRARNLVGRLLDTQTKMAGVEQALRWIVDENTMSA